MRFSLSLLISLLSCFLRSSGCYRKCDICRDYSKTYARSKYYDEAKPWNERCDIAFPCASENEIDQSDAVNLVNSGCRILVEGSAYLHYPSWFNIFFNLTLIDRDHAIFSVS